MVKIHHHLDSSSSLFASPVHAVYLSHSLFYSCCFNMQAKVLPSDPHAEHVLCIFFCVFCSVNSLFCFHFSVHDAILFSEYIVAREESCWCSTKIVLWCISYATWSNVYCTLQKSANNITQSNVGEIKKGMKMEKKINVNEEEVNFSLLVCNVRKYVTCSLSTACYGTLTAQQQQFPFTINSNSCWVSMLTRNIATSTGNNNNDNNNINIRISDGTERTEITLYMYVECWIVDGARLYELPNTEIFAVTFGLFVVCRSGRYVRLNKEAKTI